MRRPATLLIIGATIILATVLAATGPVSAASASVEITETGFNPLVVTVSPHTTVTWTNAGSQTHRIVGESGSALESPDIAPRFTYSYTFHSTGTHTYYDSKTQLKGIVIVQEGAVAPEPVLNTPPPETSSPPQATPITSGQPAVLNDNPTGGGSRSFGGAASAPPNTSLSEPSAPEIAAAPAAEPQSASSAGETSAQMGNEWFGDPSYQGGVFETVIESGGTIRWTSLEGIHNVFECGENWTKSNSCAAADWSSAQVMTAGNSFSQTFDSPGRFFYTCTIHPATMRGVVVVNAPSAPPDSSSDSNPPLDSQPDPAPTDPQLAGIPNGGGPPLNPGDSRLIMILTGAAIAFVISTLTFMGGGIRVRK